MTPQQVELVQSSFKKVAPIAPQAAEIFYERLFHIAPEVRPLFPDDMSQQKMKLITMLATAVNNLHNFDEIQSAVEDLGRRHVAYGVTPQHYKPVGEALIYTLETGLGDEFTPDVKAAWLETYNTLEDVMTRAAASVEPPKKSFMSRIFGT